MEPRYNDPRYRDIPGITMNVLKCMVGHENLADRT